MRFRPSSTRTRVPTFRRLVYVKGEGNIMLSAPESGTNANSSGEKPLVPPAAAAAAVAAEAAGLSGFRPFLDKVSPHMSPSLRVLAYVVLALYTMYTTAGNATKDYYLMGNITSYQAGEDPRPQWRSTENHIVRHLFSEVRTNRRGDFILPLSLSALPVGDIQLIMARDDRSNGDDNDNYGHDSVLHPKRRVVLPPTTYTTFYHLPDNAYTQQQAYFTTQRAAEDHYEMHVKPRLTSDAPSVLFRHRPGSESHFPSVMTTAFGGVWCG